MEKILSGKPVGDLGLIAPAHAEAARPCATKSAVPFAELHAVSNYSFLRGASDPEEMVKRAVELGISTLALVDCQ